MSSPLSVHLRSCASRLAPALTLLYLLAACGFQPMYGDAAAQAEYTSLQGNLAIDPVSGSGARIGQLMKAALEDRFNPEGLRYVRPDYHLRIKLFKTLIPSVVRQDGVILRYDVRYDSTFTLYKTGDPLHSLFTGAMRRSGSYNLIPNANFATYEAEQDVTERMLKEMAEDYLLRINGYFTGGKDLPEKASAPLPAATRRGVR